MQAIAQGCPALGSTARRADRGAAVTTATRLSRHAWTLDDVKALGLRTDLVTACQIVYGCGKNKAWEMFHANELDFPALRVGRRVVVPVQAVKRLLEVESA